MFQLSLAEELKLTLSELKEKVTDEELMLWSLYFNIKNRRHQQELEKAKRRR
jgi:hypothetical protein